MKTILVLCALILAAAVAWLVAARPWSDHYGRPFKGAPPAGVAQILEKPAQYLKKEARIEGIVVRMCPHCGCSFAVKDAVGRELRVQAGETLGRLPFHLDTKVTVEGQLIPYGDGYEFIAEAVEFH